MRRCSDTHILSIKGDCVGGARILDLVEEDDPEEHQDIHQNGGGIPVLLRPAVALHIQDLQPREVRQGDSSLQR